MEDNAFFEIPALTTRTGCLSQSNAITSSGKHSFHVKSSVIPPIAEALAWQEGTSVSAARLLLHTPSNQPLSAFA